MILRDITLKDAVQDDGTKRSTMLSKQVPANRNLASQSLEPQQKTEPSFNILPMNFGLTREGKFILNNSALALSKVQKIQKNVREWILRRQHYDIKKATQILHSELIG